MSLKKAGKSWKRSHNRRMRHKRSREIAAGDLVIVDAPYGKLERANSKPFPLPGTSLMMVELEDGRQIAATRLTLVV
jgi:hypothetical protein